jgi:cytochrome c5
MNGLLLRALGFLILVGFSPRLGAQAVSVNDAAMALAPNAAVLERGKAIYRLNECNYCHGIDLNRQPRGARADLKHNPLVGAD